MKRKYSDDTPTNLTHLTINKFKHNKLEAVYYPGAYLDNIVLKLFNAKKYILVDEYPKYTYSKTFPIEGDTERLNNFITDILDNFRDHPNIPYTLKYNLLTIFNINHTIFYYFNTNANTFRIPFYVNIIYLSGFFPDKQRFYSNIRSNQILAIACNNWCPELFFTNYLKVHGLDCDCTKDFCKYDCQCNYDSNDSIFNPKCKKLKFDKTLGVTFNSTLYNEKQKLKINKNF